MLRKQSRIFFDIMEKRFSSFMAKQTHLEIQETEERDEERENMSKIELKINGATSLSRDTNSTISSRYKSEGECELIEESITMLRSIVDTYRFQRS